MRTIERSKFDVQPFLRRSALSRLTDTPTKMTAVTASFFGSVAGIAVVATTILTTKGFIIFFPYALLFLALFWTLKRRPEITDFQRFWAGVGAFMLSTLFLYFYIIVIANPKGLKMPLWGHIWRLAIMMAIGAVISAIFTFIKRRKTALM